MPGYSGSKDAHLNRLKRIEGQIRGVTKMVEEDKYCIDILTQIAAVTKALQSVGLGLLNEHVNHCVMTAASSDQPSEARELVDEATRAFERLV